MPMWSTRPRAIRTRTAGTISSESRAATSTAPWIPSIWYRPAASTGVERNGLHFYYGDEPKPGPEFFRERHSKTRPIVCLETGETFDGNPAAARPLHVSPAAISQAVRYGTPVAGLHFYHGDEPKPAPEFFKPIKPERGKSPMQMAAAARAAAGNPGRPDGGQRPRRAV